MSTLSSSDVTPRTLPLTGIRVVRAFARQEFERAKFAAPNARYRDRSLRLMRLMAWYWSISDIVAMSQIGLTLLVVARWITEGKLKFREHVIDGLDDLAALFCAQLRGEIFGRPLARLRA
jgi:ABC-type multidrug transport system fused ATPase/permease subunit